MDWKFLWHFTVRTAYYKVFFKETGFIKHQQKRELLPNLKLMWQFWKIED